MFSVEDIQERVRRRPFQPFRIVATSGESLVVTHPELILVGQNRVIVGRPNPKRPTSFIDTAEVARMHIAAMEDLPAGPAPGERDAPPAEPGGEGR